MTTPNLSSAIYQTLAEEQGARDTAAALLRVALEAPPPSRADLAAIIAHVQVALHLDDVTLKRVTAAVADPTTLDPEHIRLLREASRGREGADAEASALREALASTRASCEQLSRVLADLGPEVGR